MIQKVKKCTAAVSAASREWVPSQVLRPMAGFLTLRSAGCGLATAGMPITSDAIKSLFGVAKQHGTGEICDANRIALRLPALKYPGF
jgi:hypothetical protein